MSAGAREVVLCFDERSYRVLQVMKEQGGWESDAATVFEALKVMRALQRQAQNGYTAVLVQHPVTFDQLQLVIDVMRSSEASSLAKN